MSKKPADVEKGEGTPPDFNHGILVESFEMILLPPIVSILDFTAPYFSITEVSNSTKPSLLP